MSCEEIARELGISANGVYKLEQSALRKLRAKMGTWSDRREDRRSNNLGSLARDER